MRTRIGFDLQLGGRNLSGTGVYCRELLKNMQELDSIEVLPINGWQRFNHVVGRSGRALRALTDAAWTQVGLPFAARKLQVDLLHAPAFFAPMLAPCPLVITVHDTIYRHYPEQYAAWWRRYLEINLGRILPRAAAIIVDSEYTRRDVVTAYAVDPNRVKVIHLGVDHSRFRPASGCDAELLSRYGLETGYVLHVGSLVARKNIPLLLEAIAILRARGDWGRRQLALVGTGSPGLPGSREVCDAINRFGLGDVVVAMGRVPDSELPAVYGNAAIFVFPSQYEGFGIPIIEAMASGVPVVAIAGSAVSEVVGNAGLLLKRHDALALADAIQEVTHNDDLRGELQQRGLSHAAQFSWEETARKTVEVYAEALRRPALSVSASG